jgi:hypothetical protein
MLLHCLQHQPIELGWADLDTQILRALQSCSRLAAALVQNIQVVQIQVFSQEVAAQHLGQATAAQFVQEAVDRAI